MNGQIFEKLSVAMLVAKDSSKIIVAYSGMGLNLFGYYVPVHTAKQKAISEFKEIAEQTTGCKLEDNVIGVYTTH